jgi:DNA-directed RNA polymerase subunit RPC12/RpoP
MAKESKRNSGQDKDPEFVDEAHVELEGSGEGDPVDEASHAYDPPRCPRCGWSNTRPSYTQTMVDTVLQLFAMRAFRCRSCGNRFRIFRRGV